MTKFRFLTAGESHGQGLNVILEGIPSNLSISEDFIEKDMSIKVPKTLISLKP